MLSATKFTASTQQRTSGAAEPRLWQRAASGPPGRGGSAGNPPRPASAGASQPAIRPGPPAHQSRPHVGASVPQTRARSAAFSVSAPQRGAAGPQRTRAGAVRWSGEPRGARPSPAAAAAAPAGPGGRAGRARVPAHPEPRPAHPALTWRSRGDMVCVVGVRRDTLSTTTQFMTMIVATTMTKMRYLRGPPHVTSQTTLPDGKAAPPQRARRREKLRCPLFRRRP